MTEPTPEELKAENAELKRQLALAQSQQSTQVSGSGSIAAEGGVAAGQGGAAYGRVRESVVVTGDNTSVKQIINYYTEAGGESHDPERMRRQISGYLNWVLERFGTIELRGIKREGQQVVQLDLETVYVPLEATDYSMNSYSWERSISLDQLLGLGNRLIVTGGPGSGKSTVLQHIAWTLAMSILKDDREMAQKKLGIGIGGKKKARGRSTASEERWELPLPIFLPLSAYAQYLRDLSSQVDPRDSTLAGFISRYLISKHTGLHLPSDFFDRLLSTDQEGEKPQPVILLLDGLDEVPSEDERAKVRQAVEDLVSGRDRMSVVATCRTTAYSGRTALGRGFIELRVKELDANTIEFLIRQAYAAIYRDDPTTRGEKASELLSGVQKLEVERQRRLGSDAAPLVTSPLLVRMLLVVHYSERRLPEQRAELYMKATDAMLLPEYVLDETVASQIGGLVGGSREAHRDLAQHLAFAMHQRGPTQGREIDEGDLRRVLSENSTFAHMVDDFIALTRLRGTLVEERMGTFRFIHLAFQEYLAARWLAEIKRGEQGIEGIVAFLEQGPVLESWWREPILLVAGYLSVTSPQTAQSFVHRLARIGMKSNSISIELPADTQVAAAELSATAALEWSALPNVQRTQLADHLASLLSRVDVTPHARPDLRVSMVNALTRLGDPRFRDDAWNLPSDSRLGFIEIPAGTFWMGSDKTIDPAAQSDEFPRHRVNLPTYYIARYLVTVAQFQAFVDSSGHKLSTRNYLRGQPTAPVTDIAWLDAVTYCDWLTETLRIWGGLPEPLATLLRVQNWRINLPSEAEWEKAARGNGETDQYIYPWGDTSEKTRCNSKALGLDSTTPVGIFPDGASPYSCLDMSGNVWEWTRSLYAPYPYPDDENQRTIREDLRSKGNRVLRGGSFNNREDDVRCAARVRIDPNYRLYGFGFRVCASPLPLVY